LAVCYAITGNHKAKDMLLAYKVRNLFEVSYFPVKKIEART
jgi:hypothetical protein